MSRQQSGPHRSAVPRYIQIAETLSARIDAGALAPGDRLPAERALSQQFGVNRMTLRQALQILEGQGRLIRRQGDGTYVAVPKIERTAGLLFPFSKAMRQRGYQPGARVVLFEQRLAEPAIAGQLGLASGAAVYYCHRLRLISAEPVMLEQFVLPAARFPGFVQYDLAIRSVYEVMEVEYGVLITRARQSLEPVLASPYEAELLTVPVGAPLMLERRLTFDQHGQPVEYSKDLYRGDRFRFVTEVAPVDRQL